MQFLLFVQQMIRCADDRRMHMYHGNKGILKRLRNRFINIHGYTNGTCITYGKIPQSILDIIGRVCEVIGSALGVGSWIRRDLCTGIWGKAGNCFLLEDDNK